MIVMAEQGVVWCLESQRKADGMQAHPLYPRLEGACKTNRGKECLTVKEAATWTALGFQTHAHEHQAVAYIDCCQSSNVLHRTHNETAPGNTPFNATHANARGEADNNKIHVMTNSTAHRIKKCEPSGTRSSTDSFGIAKTHHKQQNRDYASYKWHTPLHPPCMLPRPRLRNPNPNRYAQIP